MNSRYLHFLVLLPLLLVGCGKSAQQTALRACEEWGNKENPFAYQEDTERFEGDYLGLVRFCEDENGVVNGYEFGEEIFNKPVGNDKRMHELKRSWPYDQRRQRTLLND